MNIYQELKKSGFITEFTDDHASADGGLKNDYMTIFNSHGRYVGDVLNELGYQLSVEVSRGKRWRTFKMAGKPTICHRDFNEKNFAGQPVEVKTFSFQPLKS